jgi:hypothetical protein
MFLVCVVFPPAWCCKQRWLPLPDRARFLAEEDKFGDESSVIVTPLNIMLGDGTLTRSVDLTTVCCSPVGGGLCHSGLNLRAHLRKGLRQY